MADFLIASDRNAAVLAVLDSVTEPLGPTEIARRIGKSWCVDRGRYPQSAPINAVLKRIGAVRHPGGKYTKPAA